MQEGDKATRWTRAPFMHKCRHWPSGWPPLAPLHLSLCRSRLPRPLPTFEGPHYTAGAASGRAVNAGHASRGGHQRPPRRRRCRPPPHSCVPSTRARASRIRAAAAAAEALTRARGTASRGSWRPAAAQPWPGTGSQAAGRPPRCRPAPARSTQQHAPAPATAGHPRRPSHPPRTMAAGGRFFWNLARMVPTLPWARVTCRRTTEQDARG